MVGSLPDGVESLLHVNRYLGDPRPGVSVAEHSRPAIFVPEQGGLDSLLNTLRDGSDHTAIVVSELGVVTGLVQIEDIADELHWYVRAINMVKPPAEDVDYESNWATLTFEIK